jgi:hypothetical protein
MAWSVPIWKIYGFPKVSLYLDRFALKHATAHILTVASNVKKHPSSNETTYFGEQVH